MEWSSIFPSLYCSTSPSVVHLLDPSPMNPTLSWAQQQKIRLKDKYDQALSSHFKLANLSLKVHTTLGVSRGWAVVWDERWTQVIFLHTHSGTQFHEGTLPISRLCISWWGELLGLFNPNGMVWAIYCKINTEKSTHVVRKEVHTPLIIW